MQIRHRRALLLTPFFGYVTAKAQPEQATPPNWDAQSLTGYVLRLVSEADTELIYFETPTHVAISSRAKRGPLFEIWDRWKIEGQKLAIGGYGSYDEFELLSRNGDLLTVRRKNGRIEHFTIGSPRPSESIGPTYSR